MKWNPEHFEEKWKREWVERGLYHVSNNDARPKYYVLDMFPYPSGAGLHVGHPLGYIASDIYSRYKRLNGFNVLHPMGYDAFGLPAEQYAIQTGVHPADSTLANIAHFRKQLDNLGFSYDWSRELMTCDPKFYHWTQWIFLKFFGAYYDLSVNKALPVKQLIEHFEKSGTRGIHAHGTQELHFNAEEWHSKSKVEKEEVLMNYRLMYRRMSTVNWCEALGTVLANDEVKDGVSERGGFPVIKKPMMQWSMRTTAYAERLLEGLNLVDWPESLKIMQRNWIGRSEGARIDFKILEHEAVLEVYTTRPDTIFGATFMVMAPEHKLVEKITKPDRYDAVQAYIMSTSMRSESDRLNMDKKMTGVFTGAFTIHPFTGQHLPVYISDYVLVDYGSGAIMAVPADDERDHRFAHTFDLPVIDIIDRSQSLNKDIESKEGKLINSGFLDGLDIPEAISTAVNELEKRGIGTGLINYKLRDANYSRQRYWGEPFPIYYDKDGSPHPLEEAQLPLELPVIEDFKPSGDGSSPIAKATEWVHFEAGKTMETDTMPGFAGSSWYFLRYMDPKNDQAPFSPEAMHYWQDVDLYIGGAEHAVGHLLYARTWHKFLFDLGMTVTEEPFKKLINQGMIQGVSEKTFLIKHPQHTIFFLDENGAWKEHLLPQNLSIFLSKELKNNYPIKVKEDQMEPTDLTEILVNIELVEDYGASSGAYLDSKGIDSFRAWRPDFANAVFVTSGGYYHQGQFTKLSEAASDLFYTQSEVEKMSKSKFNVINPDEVIDQYGADVFRMYEMFLGPLEQSKPWDIQGIEGVHKFARRFWSQFFDEEGNLLITNVPPDAESLKILHKTIKKVTEDIEKFSFNTCISAFMIACNDLRRIGAHQRDIWEKMVVLLSPFAPFMTEELYQQLGHRASVHEAVWPTFDASLVVEDVISYPLCINGKKRSVHEFPAQATDEEIITTTLALPEIIKWLEGKTPKKVIVVKGRMVNIVV